MKVIVYLLFFITLIPTNLQARVGGAGGEEENETEEESYSSGISDDDNHSNQSFDDSDDDSPFTFGDFLFILIVLSIIGLFVFILLKFPNLFPKLTKELQGILRFIKK